MRPIYGSLHHQQGVPSVDVLGIDISKDDFHACLLQGEREKPNSFANNKAGYKQLLRWLKNRRCANVHACLEATGAYWMGVAQALYDSGMVVSVVNPSRTAFYARSLLRRTKTDKVDAAMIAQFCRTQQPDAWEPPAPEILEIRGLLTYRDHLVAERVKLEQAISQLQVSKELSRLHQRQMKTLDAQVKAIEEQLKVVVKRHAHIADYAARLTAVKGIGLLTALFLIAWLPVDRLRNEKAAAAYVGLTPRERRSGTSVRGQVRICKTGNGTLRKALYLAATSAMRYNAVLAPFAARLRDAGKASKVVHVAVMRKMVVLAYRLLKGTFSIPAAA